MTNNEAVYAFTTINKIGLCNRLTNSVVVVSEEKTVEALALWDTGATGTCISTEVVNKLGLSPTGKRIIRTPSGTSQVNTYLVSIILPNNVNIKDIEVCDSEIGNQGIGILIGMDIINAGDFAVSNYKGITTFSFRIPSKSTTDYAKELRIKNIIGTHGKGKRKQ